MNDHESEYGRLLAERDRLIENGVDPADLPVPTEPVPMDSREHTHAIVASVHEHVGYPAHEHRWWTVEDSTAALAPTPEAAGLREALKPFAAFADKGRVVPADFVITQGSSMAKRQLTMGDCYEARAALSSTEGTSKTGVE